MTQQRKSAYPIVLMLAVRHRKARLAVRALSDKHPPWMADLHLASLIEAQAAHKAAKAIYREQAHSGDKA